MPAAAPPRTLSAVLALAALAPALNVAAYFAGGRTQLWLAYAGWTLAAAVAFAGTLVAVRRRERRRRKAWTLLAGASGAWLIGMTMWDAYALVQAAPPAFSGADVLWWIFAALAAAAMHDVPTSRGRRGFALLEALPLALGAGAAIVAVMLSSATGAPISTAAKWGAVGYPIFYGCLTVFTVQALITGAPRLRRDPAFLLVAAGCLAESLAFIAWGPEIVNGSYVAGGEWIDPFWSLGLVVIGIAGLLRPTVVVADARAQAQRAGFLPGIAFFAIAALLAYATGTNQPARVELLLVGALMAAGVAVIGRAWLLARRQSALLLREAEVAREFSTLYRELQSVLQSAGEGIWGLDADGVLTFVNPTAERMLGWDAGEMLGRRAHDLAQHTRGDGTPYPFEESPINGATITAVNRFEGETFWRKDGTSFTAAYTSTPILETSGVVRGIVVVFRDVSQEYELEAQLRQSQKLEAIGRLAGGVAHDFNNILTAISGYTELIQERVQDDAVGQYVEGIGTATERAAALTRQLLAFSRQQVMERHVLDLNAIVDSNGHLLRRLIREDIAVALELSAEPLRVKVDPGQIGQVLLNLAVNARDAMPGTGRLEISTVRTEFGDGALIAGVPIRPGAYARLSVSDTGDGIDAETARRAFDPFFTTKAAGQGSGLGLATVYGIVKQSGGYIFIGGDSDEGTRLDVYLPLTAEPLTAAPEPHVRPAGSAERRGTILLVEDEEVVRSLLEGALARCGYEVLAAADGEAAIGLLDAAIDLLVTDVIMPGKSGRDVAEALRADAPGTPVIYISGYAEDVIDESELGARTAFIQKPFPIGVLLARVDELLDGRPLGV